MRTMNGVISWYVLALQSLFHFIACVSFLSISFFFFFVDSTTCWAIEVSLSILKIKQVCKWNFEGWLGSALFSNYCNWFGLVGEKYELHPTFTCLLELLAGEYLRETNVSVLYLINSYLFFRCLEKFFEEKRNKNK